MSAHYFCSNHNQSICVYLLSSITLETKYFICTFVSFNSLQHQLCVHITSISDRRTTSLYVQTTVISFAQVLLLYFCIFLSEPWGPFLCTAVEHRYKMAVLTTCKSPSLKYLMFTLPSYQGFLSRVHVWVAVFIVTMENLDYVIPK